MGVLWPGGQSHLVQNYVCDFMQMEVVVEGCINWNADHDRVCKHSVSPALTVCALTLG